MDINTIESLLTSIGSMGISTLILIYILKYGADKLIPTLGEFRESIEKNTLAINTLCERLSHHLDIVDKE